jgi:hypothetical protein
LVFETSFCIPTLKSESIDLFFTKWIIHPYIVAAIFFVWNLAPTWQKRFWCHKIPFMLHLVCHTIAKVSFHIDKTNSNFSQKLIPFFLIWKFENFHDLIWYCQISGEIIEGVAYDNYDDFQHVNFIVSQKLVHYFEDYLITKLTLG